MDQERIKKTLMKNGGGRFDKFRKMLKRPQKTYKNMKDNRQSYNRIKRLRGTRTNRRNRRHRRNYPNKTKNQPILTPVEPSPTPVEPLPLPIEKVDYQEKYETLKQEKQSLEKKYLHQFDIIDMKINQILDLSKFEGLRERMRQIDMDEQKMLSKYHNPNLQKPMTIHSNVEKPKEGPIVDTQSTKVVHKELPKIKTFEVEPKSENKLSPIKTNIGSAIKDRTVEHSDQLKGQCETVDEQGRRKVTKQQPKDSSEEYKQWEDNNCGEITDKNNQSLKKGDYVEYEENINGTTKKMVGTITKIINNRKTDINGNKDTNGTITIEVPNPNNKPGLRPIELSSKNVKKYNYQRTDDV